MAFSDDIVITVNAVDYTFSAISLVGSKSVRRDASRELLLPESLTISHQVGKDKTVRSMVRMDSNFTDGEGNYATASAYHCYVIPNGIVAKADVTLLDDKLISFLTDPVTRPKLFNREP